MDAAGFNNGEKTEWTDPVQAGKIPTIYRRLGSLKESRYAAPSALLKQRTNSRGRGLARFSGVHKRAAIGMLVSSSIAGACA